MRHIKQVDSDKHTVIMIQMENEVGLLGDSRDRIEAANAAFARPVPKQLMDYLQSHKADLRPELKALWDAAGDRATGTWSQVFGEGMAADEAFMAWNYARYMNQITRAGKAEYPIPVYTNTWIVQPEDRGPGDYPSGCPEPHVLDIWRAGGPDIDINAPDIYLPNFVEWVKRFHQHGNPLFVPESRGEQPALPMPSTPSARRMRSATRPSPSRSPAACSPLNPDPSPPARPTPSPCRCPRATPSCSNSLP